LLLLLLPVPAALLLFPQAESAAIQSRSNRAKKIERFI
jgi:hypothetical protein